MSVLVRSGTVFFKLLAIGFMVTACSSSKAKDLPDWIKNQPAGINIVDVVLSPNGDEIAFTYIDRSLGRNYLGLGLYNWKTNSLKRIPNPAGKQMGHASFSSDGKKLLVAIGNINGMYESRIGVVELPSLNLKEIDLPNSKGKAFPIFQPETDNILYGSGYISIGRGLRLFNPKTNQEQVIIDDQNNGFFSISRATFINKNEILFQARGPRNHDLRQQVSSVTNIVTPVTYSLKLGGSPQIFSLPAEQQAKILHSSEGAFGSMSAAEHGRKIAYIGINKIHEKSKPYSELMILEAGNAVRLTDHKSVILRSYIAENASVIAFIADIGEPRKFDLFIYDFSSKKTIPTNVLDRIRNDSVFALK